MPPLIAFLDIETNGLDPHVHQPIEVGWVSLDGDEWEEFSLPFDAERSEPRALEVNGYGKREFAPELPPSEACARLEVSLKDTHIIANNVTFDISFLTAFMRRNDCEPTWHRTGYELKSLVAGRMGISPRLVSTSSIIKQFNLPNAHAHTALGDARWNREVYKRLALWEA